MVTGKVIDGQEAQLAMGDSRFDQFTRRLANRHATRHVPTTGPLVVPEPRTPVTSRAHDALAGHTAPGFALRDTAGKQVTLASLLARGNPLLLVFVDPRCGPCYELLPDIGGWERFYGDRLSVALVSSGDGETNSAMIAGYGITTVLLQNDQEVVAAYNLAQAPAAVVIQPDGRVGAGPRFGTQPIRQLVADTLGLVLPPEPVHVTRPLEAGEMALPLRLPDLSGNAVDVFSRGGTPSLLIFWSPGCDHCAGLLPEARAYEQQLVRPRMVVISRGPARLNEALGFTSPVVLDDAGKIGDMLGVTGTPAAVLIDGRGRIGSPVARGATGVRRLMAQSLGAMRPASIDR